MKIGIFGGTFDPVHVGHLIAAGCCCEQLSLDRVLFMPASIAPHKQNFQHTSAHHRFQMLLLATQEDQRFTVSSYEIDKSGVSYTAESLVYLIEKYPDDQLLLLLGPDMISDLPNWREPEKILDLSTPVAMLRTGIDNCENIFSNDRLMKLFGTRQLDLTKKSVVQLPGIGIRSTAIRDAMALGKSIRYYVPQAVEDYIYSNQLYRAT
ncbi:MAG: nicotinate-nucleotide adenylyltransferase [Pirellulales bacterium]